ncbi:MAG: hypothetical protein FalmKO_25310 [Falsiruegeria mediterranea]
MQTRDQNILSDQPIREGVIVSGGFDGFAEMGQGHEVGSYYKDQCDIVSPRKHTQILLEARFFWVI